MGCINATPIKELATPNGGSRADIVARGDGTFQFRELIIRSGTDAGAWTPGFWSGLYLTPEAAEAAARIRLKL
jgi:hypothetical protein